MQLKNKKIVVCGGGGFIGGHLVKKLTDQGLDVVRAVDVKPLNEWYQTSKNVENLSLDLKEVESCRQAVKGVDLVFNLAADMGGMGFIENNKALCMLSVLINTNLLLESKKASRVSRSLRTSSVSAARSPSSAATNSRQASTLALHRAASSTSSYRVTVPPGRPASCATRSASSAS